MSKTKKEAPKSAETPKEEVKKVEVTETEVTETEVKEVEKEEQLDGQMPNSNDDVTNPDITTADAGDKKSDSLGKVLVGYKLTKEEAKAMADTAVKIEEINGEFYVGTSVNSGVSYTEFADLSSSLQVTVGRMLPETTQSREVRIYF